MPTCSRLAAPAAPLIRKRRRHRLPSTAAHAIGCEGASSESKPELCEAQLAIPTHAPPDGPFSSMHAATAFTHLLHNHARVRQTPARRLSLLQVQG